MDEAGIPMLVSRYINITVRPKKRDLYDTLKNIVYIIRDTSLGHTTGLTMSELKN